MDFKKAAELLSLCKEYDKPISQIMMDRECEMTEKPLDEIRSRMAVSLQIMKDATKEAINQPSQSMGGLIGGESRKLSDLQSSGKNIAGNLISKAIAYSMGVLEVNASMGLIVAAPTAGSSGVIPGVLLALQEEYDFTDDQIIDALFTCSAIGYLAMHQCNPLLVPSADVRPKSALLPQWPAACCCRVDGRNTGTMYRCRLNSAYEHVGSCLRPGGWPGRISMPEPKCIRCIQRHCGR